ncbi:MAG TPA: sugar transferase [Vicinamibacterales bacterium]|nr:sugar transferase [Vicinamibacterales bacterium]HOQ59406.1 sugar transferase [Vicinamibacterales bacterium]HPK70510.1 sugar transferase [Vicinamibacterales bacterium]
MPFVSSALLRENRIPIRGGVLPLDRRLNQNIKAISDRLLGAAAALLAAPLMLVVAALVKLTSEGPIIHRRRVVGRGGVEFDAFKFRTMVANADQILAADPALRREFLQKHKIEDDPRVTPVGRFLRKLSLDELPQFFNVLAGQMSVVGPRMLSPEEIDRYGAHVAALLSVKPGLTGLWQVSGRQRTTYERRIQLDMQYVRTWSLWLDLCILARTPIEVFRGTGAF